MGCHWLQVPLASSTHIQYSEQPALHLRGVRACGCPISSGSPWTHLPTGQCATTSRTQHPTFPWQTACSTSALTGMFTIFFANWIHMVHVAQRPPQPAATTTHDLRLWTEASWSAIPQADIQGLFHGIHTWYWSHILCVQTPWNCNHLIFVLSGICNINMVLSLQF